jgi:TM2 domain-containing membrane protein YozV
MNCANHSDIAAVAYCRTCGKPLCSSCTRDVKGVIYCENCLAARLEGTPASSSGMYQGVLPTGATPRVQPVMASGPNPTVAGILAGFFPFGVGAVYCGQYAKGLAHLLILTGLIWGQATTNSDGMHVFLGLAIGFFYIYQIIDSVRTARAVQTGQPVPDPFGLTRAFTTGDRVDTSRIPAGAIVLIALGVIFMLHNLGFWFLGFGRLWPLILIFVGAWLFARRTGLIGQKEAGCECDRCRAHSFMGPAILVTLGILFLLEQQDVVSFGRTCPLLLVIIGLIKVLQGNASTAGHIENRGGPGSGPGATVTGEVQPPSSEVRNG